MPQRDLGPEMRRFFKPHLPKQQLKTIVLAGLGAALAIAFLAFAADLAKTTMLVAPFGATCVLLFAAPGAPLSQPLNVVAGHFVAAAIGVATFSVLPIGILTGAVAVGIAVAAMVALRITHPPAGATALVAGAAGTWSFLLFPVLAGSLVLVLVATAYHRMTGHAYPVKHS